MDNHPAHAHDQHRNHRHDHSATTNPTWDDGLAEILDLDAEVVRPLLTDVITWIDGLTADQPVRRILDMGTGTGTGALALAAHFADADVIAVDASTDMLRRLGDKISTLPFGGRIRPVHADFDDRWPDCDNLDLIWASASLHHLKDPDRVLPQALSALQSGGLLIALEMDYFPRFLPDDIGLGAPGLEARCHAAMTELHASTDAPNLDTDWSEHLTRAGFSTPTRRSFTIDLTPPLPAATGRYAHALLSRLRAGLDTRLSSEDLATLDALTTEGGPHAVLHRADLTVRATRTAWAARRP